MDRRFHQRFFSYIPVLSAPFDILFPGGIINDDSIIGVVQPDFLVICDPLQTRRQGASGLSVIFLLT